MYEVYAYMSSWGLATGLITAFAVLLVVARSPSIALLATLCLVQVVGGVLASLCAMQVRR